MRLVMKQLEWLILSRFSDTACPASQVLLIKLAHHGKCGDDLPHVTRHATAQVDYLRSRLSDTASDVTSQTSPSRKVYVTYRMRFVIQQLKRFAFGAAAAFRAI